MRILITGANGLLGKKALEILGRKNEVIGTARNSKEGLIKMDLNNREEVISIIDKFRPDVLFNCASITDVDLCEKDKLLAFETHVKSPLLLAEICKRNKIKFVGISSDYVFSGNNSPYFEDSEAHPINFYGFTKLMMEKAISYIDPNSIIIRPSILYGFDSLEKGKDRLVMPVIGNLKKGQEIVIGDFRLKYPVLIDDFIKNALILIEKDEKGIFNFSTNRPINRLEMSMIVAKVFNLDEKLIKTNKKEFKNKPQNIELINRRMPSLKFVSFEEGVNIIKSQIGDNLRWK